MSNVHVAPQAEDELLQIALRIAQEQPGAAQRLVHEFRTLCGNLAHSPHMGRRCEIKSTVPGQLRMITIPHFETFLVFYRTREPQTAVEILHIADGRRDLPVLFTDWFSEPQSKDPGPRD